MFHLVARARRRTWLFHSWSEARALWDRVVRGCPGAGAIALMPNHLHVLHEADVRRRLAAAFSGYVRWRNHRRGEHGAGLDRLPDAHLLPTADKRRRNVRYVHLNPCRADLCHDPLAWPFTTHRDACGLIVGSPFRPHPDPAWLHRYVSSDPKVHVEGTELPFEHRVAPPAIQVLHAVSAVTRTPLPALRRRGPARSLFLRSARTLSADPHRTIAELAGVCRQAVVAAPTGLDRRVRVVARVVGDPRFAPLHAGDLRRTGFGHGTA